ncbi:D-alanyl-D-alanine dipeptidase [Acidovorax soli]|uniref:D-alanyl-D-alanine dipeptidase n=1 Tax=Acidovorax soli TaxID=592050 RepID=A0A7X0PDJ6_9BURK|nr:M15 family metallopeptidase [Acidovorax soli]MBB6559925.1 D-alanyl-D-alanine dipeptidase [Acidovorax soli]
MHTIHRTPTTASRSPWLSLAAVALLAACAQSPQAAVPPVALAAPSGATSVVQGQDCGATGQPAALRAVDDSLKALGLALKARCHAESGAWVVRVAVVDGLRASKLVRGPLADGGEVDMGTPSGVVAPASQVFSPDVHYNRQWLRTLMARHQFDNLPDAWWHYTQRGVPAPASDTDLAAR